MVERFLRALRKGDARTITTPSPARRRRQDGPTAPEMLAIVAKYLGETPSANSTSAYVDPEARLDVKDILHRSHGSTRRACEGRHHDGRGRSTALRRRAQVTGARDRRGPSVRRRRLVVSRREVRSVDLDPRIRSNGGAAAFGVLHAGDHWSRLTRHRLNLARDEIPCLVVTIDDDARRTVIDFHQPSRAIVGIVRASESELRGEGHREQPTQNRSSHYVVRSNQIITWRDSPAPHCLTCWVSFSNPAERLCQ